jgi:hypothetical protein
MCSPSKAFQENITDGNLLHELKVKAAAKQTKQTSKRARKKYRR